MPQQLDIEEKLARVMAEGLDGLKNSLVKVDVFHSPATQNNQQWTEEELLDFDAVCAELFEEIRERTDSVIEEACSPVSQPAGPKA